MAFQQGKPGVAQAGHQTVAPQQTGDKPGEIFNLALGLGLGFGTGDWSHALGSVVGDTAAGAILSKKTPTPPNTDTKPTLNTDDKDDDSTEGDDGNELASASMIPELGQTLSMLQQQPSPFFNPTQWWG